MINSKHVRQAVKGLGIALGVVIFLTLLIIDGCRSSDEADVYDNIEREYCDIVAQGVIRDWNDDIDCGKWNGR